MKQILAVIVVIFTVVSIIAIIFTFDQVNRESARLEADIQSRSALLADGLKETVEPNFINKSDVYLQSLVERYANNKRIAGLAIVDNKGKIIAVSSSLPEQIAQPEQVASNVMDADKADGTIASINGSKMYIYATPLHDKKNVVGALVIVQNAAYIDSRLFEIWTGNATRIIVQALLISLVVLLIIRWIIYKPIQRLVESLRTSRLLPQKQEKENIPSNSIFSPLLAEVSHMQQSLIQARLAASEEARLSLEKLDSPWTADRLKQFVQEMFNKRKIIVVSLREPYIHIKEGNTITYKLPVTGVVTAIEPILEACGGLWIALATGNADKLVVDKHDKIAVPPENPKYTLKRVWLSDEETKGFYYGATKQGLSRILHMVYVEPIFRQEDWQQYKIANQKYADSVLKEIKDIKKPIILIQDFQFVLLPQLIKQVRPDATVMIFWHVPWVNAETFSACPWRKEILEGMLWADLLGFHTQLHCNNFIDTVAKELEAQIDFEKFAVTKNGHTSLVRAFPVSIDFTGRVEENTQDNDTAIQDRILKDLGIKSEYVGLGVDRLDNVKGVLERVKSIEVFLKKYPEYHGKFTFLQLSSPIDSKIAKADSYAVTVEQEIERINNLYKTNGWKPIVFVKKYQTHKQLENYFRLANFCLITSLHEGMNLISKEFVAARNDEKGVLILSQFTGASKELKDALIINPYDTEGTAKAMLSALEMHPNEQKKRMRKLRNIVKNYNTYRWAAEILKTLIGVE